MKKLFIIFALSLSAFAVDSTDGEAFNKAYWAAQPKEVQALREVMHSPEKDRQVEALAKKGFVIDYPIVGWGWDPFKVMSLRQNVYKMSYVPSALGTPYIKVSLDLNDYPRYPDPLKIEPGKDSPVGEEVGYGNRYYPTQYDNLKDFPDGVLYKDARGTFKKSVVPLQPNPFNPGGYSVVWEKQ
jgi:hypothetical protein